MIIYCSKLGLIEISYCLSLNEGFPCKNIIGCWKDRTDILRILKEKFSEKELREIFAIEGSSKISKILEIIKKQ